MAKFGNNELAKKLLDLKQDIEQQKNDKLRLEGQLKVLMNQLESKFNITSLDKAEERLIEMEEVLSSAKDKLTKEISELEAELEQ
jgi:predicted  nucleic acid-binding Zn-ribbon protein